MSCPGIAARWWAHAFSLRKSGATVLMPNARSKLQTTRRFEGPTFNIWKGEIQRVVVPASASRQGAPESLASIDYAWVIMAIRRTRRQHGLAAGTNRVPIRALILVALSGIFLLNSCTLPQRSSSDVAMPAVVPSEYDFSGRVTRTVDGDTFRISSRSVSIRVWGLDAPETDQSGGAAATSSLTRLIAGQDLRCQQRDIDRYGRIVGQCVLPDGRDTTAVMIASGTAREYCRFSGNYYGTC